MKKLIVILAMIAVVGTPAMAAVTVSCAQVGTTNSFTVSYAGAIPADPDNAVRAFAMDISVSNGTITNVNCSNASYGIYPGSIQITGGVVTSAGTCVCDSETYPYPSGTGYGTSAVTVEMGSLYTGTERPLASGVLMTVDTTSTLPVTITVTANTARGGVVMENPAIALTGTLSTCVLTAPSCTVPDVVNVVEATATAAITTAGFTLGTRTTAGHNSIVAGKVISTTPAAGATPGCGTAVAYVVSTGPCVVPNAVGMWESASMNTNNAMTAITNAGFVNGTRTTSTSATVAAGKVISTTPASGATPGCGTTVTRVVSTGPLACATCPGDMIPNSVKELNDMGLIKSKLVAAYARTGLYKAIKGDQVTGDQWHICGDMVPNGSLELNDMGALKAQLVAGFTAGGLYKAPFVPINNPRKTEAQMRSAITTAKLVVGAVTYAGDPTVPNGYVISTTPAYPTYRNCNTSVAILVDNTTP